MIRANSTIRALAFGLALSAIAAAAAADNKTQFNLLANYALVPGIDGAGGMDGGH